MAASITASIQYLLPGRQMTKPGPCKFHSFYRYYFIFLQPISSNSGIGRVLRNCINPFSHCAEEGRGISLPVCADNFHFSASLCPKQNHVILLPMTVAGGQIILSHNQFRLSILLIPEHV